MRNIKLTLEYDGSNYAGWQRQNNAMTIQQKIEESIKEIMNEECKVTGCSRTDSGVHAKEYVCNFYTESAIVDWKIGNALNSKLPLDIRIISSEEVNSEFHSRYNCIKKTYCYTIFNRDVCSALYRNYVCHVKQPINVSIIKEASKYLLGTHDFSAFKSSGSSVKTSVRTIKDINIIKDNNYIRVYVSADGFLYNMMRIICGTLIEIGQGKRSVNEMDFILKSCDRTKAGKSAPAQGLCLEKVYY